MVKCSFCNTDINPGTGTDYIKKDGKILHFCSNKCEKNTFKLGRKNIKTRWSGHYQKK